MTTKSQEKKKIRGKYAQKNKWNDEFDVEVGDLVSCFPYTNIFYEVFGFDNHNDQKMISVIDGTNIITRNIDDVIEVKAGKKQKPRQSWKDRRKKRSRIEEALKQDLSIKGR